MPWATYRRILVPYDGSPSALRGLQEAVAIAEAFGGQLRLAMVIDEQPLVYAGSAPSGLPSVRDDALRLLDAAGRSVSAAGVAVDTVLHDTAEGAVHDVLLAEAVAWRADLIVLGTHGRRGIERVVLGSTAENVLRRSDIPLLLVRAA